MKQIQSMKERLLRFVDKRGKNECWPWLGGRSKSGYGQLHQTLKPGSTDNRHKRQKHWKAHRAYLVFVVGKKVSDDAHVCHTCDNPPCCNPRHLVIADRKWNVRDMILKDRRARTKLTVKQMSSIKRSLKHHIISRPEVCDRFRIRDEVVRRIVKGEYWKHIEPLGPIDVLRASPKLTPLARRLRVSIRKHGLRETARRLQWSVGKLRRLAYPLAPGHIYRNGK